jgi:hypothetical protein
MPFEKGKPKTGGRKKGTPNRSTEEMRLLLKSFADGELENIATYFQDIKGGYNKLDMLVKLLKFNIGTKKDIEGEIDVNHNGKIEIDFRFGDKDVDDDMKDIIDNI